MGELPERRFNDPPRLGYKRRMGVQERIVRWPLAAPDAPGAAEDPHSEAAETAVVVDTEGWRGETTQDPEVPLDLGVLKAQFGTGELQLDQYLKGLVSARALRRPAEPTNHGISEATSTPHAGVPDIGAPAMTAPDSAGPHDAVSSEPIAPDETPLPNQASELRPADPAFTAPAAPSGVSHPAGRHSKIAAWLGVTGLIGIAVAGFVAWMGQLIAALDSPPPEAVSFAQPHAPAPLAAPAAPMDFEAALVPDLPEPVVEATLPATLAPSVKAAAARPSVGFATQRMLVIPESTRFITLKVARTGRLREPLSLSVRAVSGAARMNEDFVPPTTTLVLRPGQASGQVLVSLLQDSERENVEDFSVVLASEDGRATLGAAW